MYCTEGNQGAVATEQSCGKRDIVYKYYYNDTRSIYIPVEAPSEPSSSLIHWPRAVDGAAVAAQLFLLRWELVIISDLLSLQNIPPSEDNNMLLFEQFVRRDHPRVGIRAAWMVDKPRHAAQFSGVDDVLLVQPKEVAAAHALLLIPRLPLVRHDLPDFLPDVFHDHLMLGEMGLCKQAKAVDVRFQDV